MAQRILIVDDEAGIATFIDEVLGLAGFEARVLVANGPRHLNAILEALPATDLVLLDINMHGLNGIDILRRIRLSYSRTQLPVIMMTGMHDSAIVVEALESGASDYLTKPIDVDVAVARIKTQLQLKSAETQLKELADSLELRVSERTEELRQSEERFRLLAENSSDMISSHDAEGRFLYVSPASQTIFGKPPESLTGSYLEDLCPPPMKAEMREQFAAARDRNTQGAIKYRIVGPDRRTHWVETTLKGLVGPGNETRVQASTRDISERMQLEQELSQLHKMEAIGVLAAGIAHEINTPIQFIGHNSHFIADAVRDSLALVRRCRELTASGLPAAQLASAVAEALATFDYDYLATELPRALDDSADGIQRVSRIVSAMKEFSHRDHETVSRVPCNINKSLQTAGILVHSEIKYVADLQFDLDDRLPQINCYPDELNQAFLNLIVNAAHAIAELNNRGGDCRGAITVRTRCVGNEVEVMISDTGCGIATEIQDRIFEPFFTTKEIGKGTGMGLSLVHDTVVNKHRGRLSFVTEPGRGTDFRIVLPIDME